MNLYFYIFEKGDLGLAGDSGLPGIPGTAGFPGKRGMKVCTLKY